MEPVCSLCDGEQTGFNKIHKMAINQLGNHTGKKGQATWVRLNVPFIFVGYRNNRFFTIQILIF